MSKLDQMLELYHVQLQSLKPEQSYDGSLLYEIVRQLGPGNYKTDISLVSTSDEGALQYIRQHYLIERLGLPDGPALDEAIQNVVAAMKGEKHKYRAVFYYLLMEELKLFNANIREPEAGVLYEGSIDEATNSEKQGSVILGLDYYAMMFTRCDAASNLMDYGDFDVAQDERWGSLLVLESRQYGRLYFQVSENALHKLTTDLTGYSGAMLSVKTQIAEPMIFEGMFEQHGKKIPLSICLNEQTRTFSRYTDPEDGDLTVSGIAEPQKHERWGKIFRLQNGSAEPQYFQLSGEKLREITLDLSGLTGLELLWQNVS